MLQRTAVFGRRRRAKGGGTWETSQMRLGRARFSPTVHSVGGTVPRLLALHGAATGLQVAGVLENGAEQHRRYIARNGAVGVGGRSALQWCRVNVGE